MGHTTHALTPVTAEYVFTGQLAHTLALLAPATPEYAPAGQLTHALALLAPVRFEYVPAEQFTHTSDTLYVPARHDNMHCFTLVLFALLNQSAGHGKHCKT